MMTLTRAKGQTSSFGGASASILPLGQRPDVTRAKGQTYTGQGPSTPITSYSGQGPDATRAKGQMFSSGVASASNLPTTRAKGQTYTGQGPSTPITSYSGQGPDATRAKGQMFSSGVASASNLPSPTFAVRSGPAAIAELYSPPRVTAALPRQSVSGHRVPGLSGLVAGSTFDLYADAAGVTWDFTRPSDRKRAWIR